MGKLSLVKELPLIFLNDDATFENGNVEGQEDASTGG